MRACPGLCSQASLSTDSTFRSVLIHRVSKRQSQAPFSKAKGAVQQVMFHPDKPFFFLARYCCWLAVRACGLMYFMLARLAAVSATCACSIS